MSKHRSLFLLLIALVSCRQETKFHEVKVDERTSIAIPDYMKLSGNSNEHVVLKYTYPEKDFYLLIISEVKEDLSNFDMDYSIDGYFAHITSNPLIANIKEGKLSKTKSRIINGMNARETEITGKLNNLGVYYEFVVVESDKKFYQLVTWTRADNKEELKPDMDKMIASFKSFEIKE